MPGTRGEGSTGRRVLAVLLTVVPVLGLGFLLGVGLPEGKGGGSSPAAGTATAEPPVFEVYVARTEEAAGLEGWLAGAAGASEPVYRLRGTGIDAPSLQTDMTLTDLPVEEVLLRWDRRGRAEGWRFDPELTARIGAVDADAVLRAYEKDGTYRIVVVGPPGGGTGTGRPVTIFQGAFGAR